MLTKREKYRFWENFSLFGISVKYYMRQILRGIQVKRNEIFYEIVSAYKNSHLCVAGVKVFMMPSYLKIYYISSAPFFPLYYSKLIKLFNNERTGYCMKNTNFLYFTLADLSVCFFFKFVARLYHEEPLKYIQIHIS